MDIEGVKHRARLRSARSSCALFLTLAVIAGCTQTPEVQSTPSVAAVEPLPDAQWPWNDAAKSTIVSGVTRWSKKSLDGTQLDLLEIDFAANKKLSFGLSDQDLWDAAPGDNETDYSPMSALGAAQRLSAAPNGGKTIAVWNGLFFAYDRSKNLPEGMAKHIGPAVIDGIPRYNVGSHRWTFGVSKEGEFGVRFKPLFSELREFRFAADGAQCLILSGKPLRLAPYPVRPIPPGTRLSRSEDSPNDAGAIPVTDHIRTSRASIGWSEDSKRLYVLFVIEPDTETESIRRLRSGEPLGAGWNTYDLQSFWQSKEVWGAINSDGGNVTQFTIRRPDGRFDFQPSKSSRDTTRRVVSEDEHVQVGGGTLLYFWIRERE